MPGSDDSKTVKKTTTFEGGASHEKTEDHMPLSPTAGGNEDAEHRDPPLVDTSIKKESRSNAPGVDEPGERENLGENELDPEDKKFPPRGNGQFKSALSSPSVDGTSGVLTRQGELDTRREQNEQQAFQKVAEETNFDANQTSTYLEKRGSGERNSTNFQVSQDDEADDAASTFGDNQSIVSRRGTDYNPKNFGNRSLKHLKHTAIDPSSLLNLKPGREHSKVTIEQKKQLKKCKVALYVRIP
ncbi:uncharacterized protein N7483_000406 [Penicillium malachiteum]|uniref:uncharacterized protein n=1 Tax=Penicillium malachiteum TaxID=1324776 RepID=UPI002546E49F|nr:uncharacterized protein N7483_000406 [Penicillium malachiteum]KAJ5735281.1 hypothetical protein N7483_000406 [Penicillium malachiteum]